MNKINLTDTEALIITILGIAFMWAVCFAPIKVVVRF